MARKPEQFDQHRHDAIIQMTHILILHLWFRLLLLICRLLVVGQGPIIIVTVTKYLMYLIPRTDKQI